MLKPYLQKLISKQTLTEQEAEASMDIILDGVDPHQTAAFLAILKYRGESIDEMIGMTSSLRKRSVNVSIPYPVIDIVGTGGDMANTVNISTGAAILTAACGIPVAKHGNRSVSSRSGSADLLEALQININSTPDQVVNSLQQASIAFMLGPDYHPVLKQVAPIRRGLKFTTVFNILCPLFNPAYAEYAVIGVSDLNTLEQMSQLILRFKHYKRVLVYHGSGLDELTPLGKAIAYDIHNGERKKSVIDPAALGCQPCTLQALQGGDASVNATILLEVFAGKPGPIADSLVLTAGAAAWIFNKTPDLKEGMQMAREALRNGKALDVLAKWREACT